MRILLADHHIEAADGLTRSLRQSGYVTDCVKSGHEVGLALAAQEFDLLILDYSLPVVSGLEVVKRLRMRNCNLPVFILSDVDSVELRVRALDAGADDFMAKPFAISELEARARALIRRGVGAAPIVLRHGPISLDKVGRIAHINDRMLALSARELGLLEVLLQRIGQLVLKEQLAVRLCEWGEAVSHNAIEVYVHRLRKKMAGNGLRIATVRGMGYSLEKIPDPLCHQAHGRSDVHP